MKIRFVGYPLAPMTRTRLKRQSTQRKRRGEPSDRRTAAMMPNANTTLWLTTSWILPAILLWVAGVHATGAFGVFVFDDESLLKNEALQNFFGFEWFRLAKRPLTLATFAANFTLFGPTTLGCHVTNITIHVAAVASIYAVIIRSIDSLDVQKQITNPRSGRSTAWMAGSIALLWGVHPLTTAAVSYIVQRAEALASLMMILTILFWSKAFETRSNNTTTSTSLDGRLRVRWAVAAIAAAWAAYGSKEVAAGLPLLVLAYDRIFVAASWPQIFRRAGWYAALILPVFIGAVLIVPKLAGSSSGRHTVGFGIEGLSSWDYFVSQPQVFLQYFRLSVFPVGQALDYGWIPSREPIHQWLGIVGWILIFACGVLLWRWSRPIAYAAFVAFVVLAPTSTFIPLQDIIFEHRFYLPLAMLISSFSTPWLLRRYGSDNPSVRLGSLLIVMIVAGFYSALSIRRNLQYTSASRIHQVDTETHPENPRAWYGLAMTARFDSAVLKIELLDRAVKLSEKRDFFYAGTDYKWRRDLADEWFMSGHPSQSRQHYLAALTHSNNELQRTEILFQLAMIASMEGRNSESNELFEQALSGDPRIRDKVRDVYRVHQERIGSGPQAD